VAKMAAELVEAKVSERRRFRPGWSGDGAGAGRPAKVCTFRPGPRGAARPKLRSGPWSQPRVAGSGRGGGEAGGGVPNLNPMFPPAPCALACGRVSPTDPSS
jgi:hypothetical protein